MLKKLRKNRLDMVNYKKRVALEILLGLCFFNSENSLDCSHFTMYSRIKQTVEN